MATVRKCPNCESDDKDRTIYECKAGCGFRGCHKSGWIGSSGCWKGTECPRCQSREGSRAVASITGIDSN